MKLLSKNLASLFSADVIRRLLGFIAVAYLARVLGASEFGVINMGFAILAYGMVLSVGGLVIYGTRSVAQGKSAEMIGRIVSERFVTTCIVFGFIAVISFFCIPGQTERWFIVLFALTLFPQVFFLDWFFQGKEILWIVSSARVLSAVTYTLIVIIFVRTPAQIIFVAAGAFIGDCVASSFMFNRLRKKYPGLKIQFHPSFQLFIRSLPLGLGMITATMVINFPQLILGVVKSTSEVGIYSAASKLVFFLLIGDRMLTSVFLPASSRKNMESTQKLAQMVNDANRWIFIFAFPLAVGCVMVAEQFIVLVFGSQYVIATSVFKVYVWYFFLTMFHTVFTSGLIALQQERIYGKIIGVTAVFYAVLVTCGSILFGALGAAFGVVVSEGLSLFLLWNALRKFIPLVPPRTTIRILGSAFVMAIILILFNELNIIFLIPLSIVTYCVSLFVLRGIQIADVRSLLERFA